METGELHQVEPGSREQRLDVILIAIKATENSKTILKHSPQLGLIV